MRLSVLIRNLNEAKSLEQTLVALQKQQTSFEYEVVVIDNESDDNSVEIALRRGCKVFTLPRKEFTYGRALNFGISKCSGEIILILSAHVILLNEFFLQKIPPYFKDENIAGLRFVLGSSIEKVRDSICIGPQKLTYEKTEDFAKRNWTNFIVNHCAAIKRSCWEIQPFDEKIFGSEDKVWGLDILKKNFALLYNVPCFYIYIRPVERKHKIEKQVIDIAAKEMITGEKENLFSMPYARSFFSKFSWEFKHAFAQLVIHHQVYKSIKQFKKEQSLPK